MGRVDSLQANKEKKRARAIGMQGYARDHQKTFTLSGGASTETGLAGGMQTWVSALGQRCPNDINSLRDLDNSWPALSTSYLGVNLTHPDCCFHLLLSTYLLLGRLG